MTLGDKIYQLRKERGLSQEALAEQLGATRQAVSKWETNQGFPETEKLLRLSSILGVSTDFLLKDEQTVRSAEAGYYVSRRWRRVFSPTPGRYAGILAPAFFCWAITVCPYVLLRDIPELRLFGMALFVVLGVILVVLAMFTEQESYRVLKREPLLFDYAYLRELTEEYRVRKRNTPSSLCPLPSCSYWASWLWRTQPVASFPGAPPRADLSRMGSGPSGVCLCSRHDGVV